MVSQRAYLMKISFMFEPSSHSVLKNISQQFLNYYSVHPFCMQVMKNQEAVDLVKSIKDPQAAAKRLTTEALTRKSKDDISCIVIRFRC
jgi:hypothetical protein